MKNVYIVAIPKKVVWIFLAFMSVGILIFANLNTAHAYTVEPQPSATTLTWGSVSSATDTFNTASELSSDGRYLMFASDSPLLVAGDTNGARDIFVKDLDTGNVVRASVANDGSQLSSGASSSGNPVMSPNGRYVAFTVVASSHDQVYVRDLTDNTTTLASSDSSGIIANNDMFPLSISNDGTVMEEGWATNLVSGVTSGANIYLKDLSSGSIEQLPFVDPTGNGDSWSVNNSYGSLSADGSTAVVYAFDNTTNYRTDGNAQIPQVVAINLNDGTSQIVSANPAGAPTDFFYFMNNGVSDTGKYVLFQSADTSLLGGGTTADLYEKDLDTGTVSAVDQLPSGRSLNGQVDNGFWSSVSDDGRYVGFDSSATTLDASYNPTRVTVGGSEVGESLYVRDMTNSSATMVVNQSVLIGGSYAAEANSFSFSTSDRIDQAAPPDDGNDIEVYIAQQ